MQLKANNRKIQNTIITLLESDKEEAWLKAKELLKDISKATIQLEYPSLIYYRGVVNDYLAKKNINNVEKSALFLNKALEAYQDIQEIFDKRSQYYSFAEIRLEELWLWYLNRGIRYHESEIEDAAIECFEICKKIKPEESYAYLYTAISAHQSKDYPLAIDNYEKCLRLDMHLEEIYYGLSNVVYVHSKDFEKCISIIEEGLKHFPFSRYLLDQKAYIYTQNQILEIKIQEIENTVTSLSLNASESNFENILPITFYHLAYLYAYAGNINVAILYYLKVLEFKKGLFEVYFEVAKLYYERALEALEKLKKDSMNLFPNEVKALNEDINKTLENACIYFEKAKQYNSTDINILQFLKNIYDFLDKESELNEVKEQLLHLKT